MRRTAWSRRHSHPLCIKRSEDDSNDFFIATCRYQHYLENVLEVADEYQEVGDLLLRHATLLATNQDLKEHQRKCAELAEKIRTELQVGCCRGDEFWSGGQGSIGQ